MSEYPLVKVEKEIIQVEVKRVEKKEQQLPAWVIEMYKEAGLFDENAIFSDFGSRRR
jgi:hypothetical protein